MLSLQENVATPTLGLGVGQMRVDRELMVDTGRLAFHHDFSPTDQAAVWGEGGVVPGGGKGRGVRGPPRGSRGNMMCLVRARERLSQEKQGHEIKRR